LEDPAELQRQCEQQQHERLNEAGCLDGFKAHPKFPGDGYMGVSLNGGIPKTPQNDHF